MTETRRPRFEPEQEVRFAVVMYGGVSLAIYINGVAQELFGLVQATAPAVPLAGRDPEAPARVFHPDGDGGPHALPASARVYRELGQRLGLGGLGAAPDGADAAGEPPAVRTRFVVDVVSGTSAGGINGVLLAKALANQSDFSISRRIWLDVADIARLTRGDRSWEGMPPQPRPEPASLLNGRRLHWEARAVLADLSRSAVGQDDPFRPAYAEQLDLAVTATDLSGLPVPVRFDARRDVLERQHRAVFEFSYGTAATTGEEHSEFLPAHDGMLAFAARATSSFPFAFEPVSHESLPAAGGDLAPDGWFGAFRRRRVPDPRRIWFADGGYLDNKPFSYATQALRRRRADLPVTRKLLYVEPRPTVDPQPADAYDGVRPDVFANVVAALRLPAFEPIRQDVADVAERNGRIARLRDIEQEAVRALRDAPAPAPGWQAAESGHPAYESLRVRMTLDRLAAAVTALAGGLVDDDVERAVREALRDWASAQPADAVPGLLASLDVGYRDRRLSFLHDRVNEAMRSPAAPVAALRALKLALNGAFDALRRAQRAPFAIDEAEVLGSQAGAGSQRALFGAVRETAVALARSAATAGEDAAGASAAGGSAAAGAFARAVAAFLAEPLARFDAGVAEAFDAWEGDPATGAALRALDARFPRVDLLVLPLAYPDLGEVNAVEIWRVSPRDAGGVVERGTPRLAGSALMNFGAFLHRPYRANDRLWGRLDGAEVILDSVLPPDVEEDERARLRTRLHAAILRETLADELQRPSALLDALEADLRRIEEPRGRPATDAEVVEAFRRAWELPGPLPRAAQLALLGRTLRETREVLVEGAGRRTLLRVALAPLAGVSRGVERSALLSGGALRARDGAVAAVRRGAGWLRERLPGR